MQAYEALILGIIQGLTEFLPVSSKGHLLAARYLFGIDDSGGLAFDAFLHLGTLGAVLLYFWPVWRGMLRAVVRDDAEGKDKRELFAKLCIATVPAALTGYFFQDEITSALRNPHLLVAGFLGTALVLGFFDHVVVRPVTLKRAHYKDALIIGLAQIAALLPGVSRSGVTIAAGRARGLSRPQATTFSFLLSAPIIAGAGLASLPKLIGLAELPVSLLALGFVAALCSGLLAIHALLKIVAKYSLTPFVIYLVGLAILITYVTSRGG